MNPAQTALEITQPRFNKDTRELATLAKTKTADDLKKLNGVSIINR